MRSFLISHKVFLVFLVISVTVFFLWLLAFYPGTMSPDSVDQWYQASHFWFLDDHPYLHTLFILSFQRVFGSPVAVAASQIILTSTFFSYSLSYFWKRGVNKIILVLSFILLLTSIPIGIYNITLWKDVPFSLAVVAAAFLFFKIKIESKLDYKTLVLLLVVSVISIFFRHNGLVYILLFFVLTILSFPGVKKKIIYISLLVLIFVVLKFIVPVALKVNSLPSWMSNSYIFHSSAAYYSFLPSTAITTKLRYIFQKLGSAGDIKQIYTPTNSNSLYNIPNFNSIAYNDFSDSQFWTPLRNEFFKNTIYNINFYIGERTTQFLTETLGYGALFNDSISPTTTQLYIDNYGARSYSTGFIQKPVLPSLYKILINILEFSKYYIPLRLIVWNTLIPFLVLIGLSVDSLYRKKTSFLIFAVTILIQFPVLFFTSPSDNWRYFYFFYLSLFLVIPIYILSTRKIGVN